MAQRRSRRNQDRKKRPELRTGGGRQAKAARSAERQAAVSRSAASGPALRMRPPGAAGMAVVLAVAWLAVAGVAIVGLVLDRWNVVGYPDSLWLYVGIGCAAVAAAVGRVARGPADANAWGLQSLVVPAGLFVAEAVLGPSCPAGADCSTVGARGSLGTALSLLVIALLAAISWGLARWMYRAAARRRPASGRVKARYAVIAMLAVLLFPGTVVAAALVGTDLLTRDTPDLAFQAERQVEEDCFGIEGAPALVARPAPEGYTSVWRTFAVRQADEDRKGIKQPAKASKDEAAKEGDAEKDDATKDAATNDADRDDAPRDSPKAKATTRYEPLPDDWTTLSTVHPYEATVSFNRDGAPVHVTCRKVAGGQALREDVTDVEPDSNPMSPKQIGVEFLPRFFTQGVAGPNKEAQKAAAKEAAKEAPHEEQPGEDHAE